MRLQVNEEKSDVRKPDDVQFLGFRFRCAKEGGAKKNAGPNEARRSLPIADDRRSPSRGETTGGGLRTSTLQPMPPIP
jgi:hypothetical protein